jgi:thioesterase domain-containing protein
MGWSGWASGGVEVHFVPGNHANMMYPPQVEALAKALTACLERAAEAGQDRAAGELSH